MHLFIPSKDMRRSNLYNKETLWSSQAMEFQKTIIHCSEKGSFLEDQERWIRENGILIGAWTRWEFDNSLEMQAL